MIDPTAVAQGATGEHAFTNGWLNRATQIRSPNFDARPAGAQLSVVVLHHISLPAGVFGGDAVERLFTNRIAADDPDLGELVNLRVSAHFFLRRSGQLLQFVSVLDRAWHAGVSSWRGRERVNDFSIGIEIEGDSHTAFTDQQYEALNHLLHDIRYSSTLISLTTHGEIAFGRKVDPGPKFDFALLK